MATQVNLRRAGSVGYFIFVLCSVCLEVKLLFKSYITIKVYSPRKTFKHVLCNVQSMTNDLRPMLKLCCIICLWQSYIFIITKFERTIAAATFLTTAVCCHAILCKAVMVSPACAFQKNIFVIAHVTAKGFKGFKCVSPCSCKENANQIHVMTEVFEQRKVN